MQIGKYDLGPMAGYGIRNNEDTIQEGDEYFDTCIRQWVVTNSVGFQVGHIKKRVRNVIEYRYKSKFNMENNEVLTVTKQQVLEAAKNHKVNTGLLKDLFPSAFSNFKPLRPGDRFMNRVEWLVCCSNRNRTFIASINDGSCNVDKYITSEGIITENDFKFLVGVEWRDDMLIK